MIVFRDITRLWNVEWNEDWTHGMKVTQHQVLDTRIGRCHGNSHSCHSKCSLRFGRYLCLTLTLQWITCRSCERSHKAVQTYHDFLRQFIDTVFRCHGVLSCRNPTVGSDDHLTIQQRLQPLHLVQQVLPRLWANRVDSVVNKSK